MTELSLEQYRNLVYSKAWQEYRDPEIPERSIRCTRSWAGISARRLERKAALIVDNEAVSYGELARLASRVQVGLAAAGVEAEHRILLFGTDSLDYMAMWFGALRIGAVPAVVSDLYKTHELLYFITDTAARVLFIDAEQTAKAHRGG